MYVWGQSTGPNSGRYHSSTFNTLKQHYVYLNMISTFYLTEVNYDFFFAYLYKIMMDTMWQKLTIKVIVITLHWKGWRMCMVFRISFKSKLYTCIFLYSLFGPQKVTKIFFRKYFWISWESYLKKWEFSGIVRNGVPWYRSMGWKGIQRFLLGRIDRSKP